MSKVTIKFWDKEKDVYVNPNLYLVDENGDVAILQESAEPSTWRGDDTILPWSYVDYLDHIEPHFYKDGERIA